jgi:hypothetical protein
MLARKIFCGTIMKTPPGTIYMNESINRTAALRLGHTRYMGKPCVQGHSGERLTRNNDCIGCRNKAKRDAYRRTKQPSAPRVVLTPEERYIRLRESQAKYYYTPKAITARRAKKARLRAAKRNQVPKWLTEQDKQDIKAVYAMALERTKETGVVWEVDHIVPLNGSNVCGLHVPHNLQIITREENRTKTNAWVTA